MHEVKSRSLGVDFFEAGRCPPKIFAISLSAFLFISLGVGFCEERVDAKTLLEGVIESYFSMLPPFEAEYSITYPNLGHVWTHKYRTDGEKIYAERDLVEGERFRAGGDNVLIPLEGPENDSSVKQILTFDGEIYRFLDVQSDTLRKTSDERDLELYAKAFQLTNPLANPWVALLNYPEILKFGINRQSAWGINGLSANGFRFVRQENGAFEILFEEQPAAEMNLNELGLFPSRFDLRYSGGRKGGMNWRVLQTTNIEVRGQEMNFPEKIECTIDTGIEGVKAMGDYLIQVDKLNFRSIEISQSDCVLPDSVASVVINLDQKSSAEN